MNLKKQLTDSLERTRAHLIYYETKKQRVKLESPLLAHHYEQIVIALKSVSVHLEIQKQKELLK